MEYLTLARVIHVMAVIIWIGGVAMVTLVIIPAIKKMKAVGEQVDSFENIEGRFAVIAKVATLITAVSGFYMIHVLQGWYRFTELRFWWFHGMVLIWLIFSVVLFILEPLVLHRIFRKYATTDPGKTFRIMHRLHWILLILSLVVTAGAVAGSHGWLLG